MGILSVRHHAITKLVADLFLVATTLIMLSQTISGRSKYFTSAFLMVRANDGSSSTARRMATTTATKTATEPYTELLTRLQQITNLKHSQAVLSYDQLVFMPEGAAESRGAQMAALATIIHEKSTSKELKELIEKAEEQHNLQSEDVDKRTDEELIIALAKEEYEKNEKIPAELEAKRAKLSASAYVAWVKARKEQDFQQFEPVLRDCFDTAIDTAIAIRGDDTNKSLYDVMLDEFERGMASERIDEIFTEIETTLVPLLQKVLSSESKPSMDCLNGKFDISKQQELNRKIVTTLGFDEKYGRIDVSVHPFTSSSSPSDVRITSRFREDEWYQGLAGSIHEAGHAIYEQNLGNSATSIDSFLSMSCHESQSLFWERHLGLSKPFWTYATPLLNDAFGCNLSPDEVYGAVNAVNPSLIRVEADELTYPLHVILRYKIERDVVEGKLDVKDIPERWNAAMKGLLDVTVPNDAQGCLQDMHWSGLAIGYFPTYLLGAATAAQLAHYARQDIPNFDEKVSNGEFAEIKDWLKEKVHKHGRRYPSLDNLLEEQVGEKLNPKYFIDYLTEKYTELYKC